jgi:DNA adenine methylase
MNAPTRPAIRWHGGKWRLAPWIIAHFPPHRVYVEPFGGGASVLLRKPAIAAECYNDLDGQVVNVFRVLRDPASADELRRRLELTPFAREEFDDCYAPPIDDVDAARKAIALSFMGHGTDSVTRTCRTGFRAAMAGGRGDSLPAQAWASYAATIPFFTRRLLGTCIEQRDAGEIIARYDTTETLFYVDPPYVLATRSSLADGRGSTHGYRYELTDDDHMALLRRLSELRGMVALSAYPSPLYEAALRGWRRVEREAMADGGRARTEVLWLNPAAARGVSQGSLFDGAAA